MGHRFDRWRTWIGHGGRNDTWLDAWSGVHLATGIAVGWLVDPFIGLMAMVLWEPFELFVLNPVFDRLWGIEFGFESVRNVLSDIVLDAAGVAIGFWLLRSWITPPFELF